MDFALFNPPYNLPSRSPREVFDWAVRLGVFADSVGFTEYWVGEHATLGWEAIPSPELVLSALVRETETMRLCAGAHLLPYHHPATLAAQTAWMSHLTEGRYILGVGAGAYPRDAALRGFKDLSQSHAMFLEAFDIMEKVWSGEVFEHEGRYWNAGWPEDDGGYDPQRRSTPYGGTMRVGMAAISPNSPTMRFAGSRGMLPLSVFAGYDRVANHWDTYEASARENGITPNRQDFHVTGDVFCADTDREAKRRAIEGGIGRAWSEYLLPQYQKLGLLRPLIPDPDVDPMSVDIDYLAEHVWIVGSPETVVEKLQTAMDRVGGWGTTLVIAHDFMDDPGPWEQSLSLLGTEVAPKLSATVGA